jgi:hypothetical protein
MKTDPIVSEVQFARRQILESHGWDIKKLILAAIERQNLGDRRIIRSPSAKTPETGSRK